MRTNKKNLKDIYEAPAELKERPEYDGIIAKKLEEELQHYRFRTMLFGVLLVAVLFLLAIVALKKHRIKVDTPQLNSVEETQFIPRHTLPAESLWVMTYEPTPVTSALSTKTEQPISTEWIKNVAYHLIIGQQSMEAELYTKAVVHFERALKTFPDLLGVQGYLGTAYLHLQKLDRAIAHLEKALKEDESFAITSNIGAALMATDHLDRAETYLLQALAQNPTHPGCHKNLALLYRQREQPEKAFLHFETYLDLHPEDFVTLEVYVEYLIEMGRQEQCILFLDTHCLQNENENRLSLYLLLAKIEAQSTNSIGAVTALQKTTHYISPNLLLTQLNLPKFDSIRDSEEFQALIQQIELAMVTLEEPR